MSAGLVRRLGARQLQRLGASERRPAGKGKQDKARSKAQMSVHVITLAKTRPSEGMQVQRKLGKPEESLGIPP
jgi:hypothetical protein